MKINIFIAKLLNIVVFCVSRNLLPLQLNPNFNSSYVCKNKIT